MRPGRPIALLVLCAGCIDSSVDPAPSECDDSSDCDQASGEVCDEGICWGGPSDELRFAAVLVPPADRPDLPVAVLPQLSIAPDGALLGLDFPQAVNIHGRVILACPPEDPTPGYDCGSALSVGATITVERAADFAGGPPINRTVPAVAGVGPGEDAFSILLPKDEAAQYRITITPDDTVGGAGIPPGELAPPRQLNVTAEQDRQVTWLIGDSSQLKTITGCVHDGAGDGSPYRGMQVIALGRWTQLSALTRASSRSETDADGCFTLRVPVKMLDEFDILVKPAPDDILPTLRLSGLYVRDPADGEDLVYAIDPPLEMPSAPAPTSFQLPIEAPGSAGGQERVPGARVRFDTAFDLPDGESRAISVTFAAEVLTSDASSSEPGVAVVDLYPGRDYSVSVVPPPDSEFQSAFGLEVPVGGSGHRLDAILLARRVALTGVALASDGTALVGAPVQLNVSSVFRIEVGAADKDDLLDELQFPANATDEMGVFLLWVDALLFDNQASYDVEVSPQGLSFAPNWTFEQVEVPWMATSMDLGELRLPDGSWARGVVRDRHGHVVVGAELHVYQIPPEDFCTQVVGIAANAECDPPAHLRGIWASDDEGTVRIVLPDP